MSIHLKNRLSYATFGCGLALLAAPVFAQNPAITPQATQAQAVATAVPATDATQAPDQSGTIPSWLIPLAIVGGVTGVIGTGLAAWVLMESGKTISQVKRIENLMNAEISSVKNRIVTIEEIEEFFCNRLGQKYENNVTTGYLLGHAMKEMAKGQANEVVEQYVLPRIEATEQGGTKTYKSLENLANSFGRLEGETKSSIGKSEVRIAELNTEFQNLDSKTRGELENFIFNIYNLVFTQSEGDPIVGQLEERIGRYSKLVQNLRTIQPDEITRLTLREFEESISKIANQIDVAREALSKVQGQSVALEPLPYLDEKDKDKAQGLLEERRKLLRAQTAGARESLDALRDAAIELYKPLQTLWMGASVVDVDRPERTQRCRELLTQIKGILSRAELEIYQAQIGEEIDTKMVSYKFAGQPHEAPFLAQKVTKLGLKVEDRIEQGAVVVA